jgi:myo-inositol-1(or 4)-monophosphatase
MHPQEWLPRLEAGIRGLGAFQLEGWTRAVPHGLKQDPDGDASIVTRFDVESEQRLRAFLLSEFPTHSFLGEESGHTPRDPEHYWIVDPIDGTTNYTHQIPFWGPSVAYWRNGRPELALIYFPALDNMFTACRGHGAFLNGERIHTSNTTEYSMITTVALHSRSHFKHSLRLRTKVRILGSIIGNMCYLASGSFAACSGRGRLWDVAAGVLVLEEAGARFEITPALPAGDLPAFAATRAQDVLFDLDARANAMLPPLRSFLVPTQQEASDPSPQRDPRR